MFTRVEMMLGCLPSKCMDHFLNKLTEVYKLRLYEYNTLIKDYGLKLKPVHIVISRNKKYIYLGRYWYRVVYKNGKVRWIYIGREKPYRELPDPPLNPLDIVILESVQPDRFCIEIPDQLCNSLNILKYLLSLIADLDKA